MLRTSCGGWC